MQRVPHTRERGDLRRIPAELRDADHAIAKTEREEHLSRGRQRRRDAQHGSSRWRGHDRARRESGASREADASERRSSPSHHAREKRLPAFPVISRSELLTPASRSSFRAMIQSRSDSRLMYGRVEAGIDSPDSARRTMDRSARRQAVRATSNAAAVAKSPETDQSERMPSMASKECTSAVSASTMSGVIGTYGFGVSGGVASAEHTLNSSRWIRFDTSRTSSSSQIARAKPSALFSSSTVPNASTRCDAFETRMPPARPVSPLSPRVVEMLRMRPPRKRRTGTRELAC